MSFAIRFAPFIVIPKSHSTMHKHKNTTFRMAGDIDMVNSSSMDQYYLYPRLPLILKRFSFSEKMKIACRYSSQLIDFDVKKTNTPSFLPWCLETFVMLAIEANEYNDNNFRGNNHQKFIKIYNTIWNATSILAKKTCGDFSFLDIFLSLSGLTQFEFQETSLIKEYRCWLLFNDNSSPVCLKEKFIEKFGTNYEDFLLLGKLLQSLFLAHASSDIEISPAALGYLVFDLFEIPAKNLMISRSNYIHLQHSYIKSTLDPYNYLFSLCPSTQFPLIHEDDKKDILFLPLPHLLLQCVTTSLLYRITENNNKLRTDIGKYLWEKYLLQIITETGIYDEVFPEQSYTRYGSTALSPDVLARQGESILFIESKSTVPSLDIRLLNPRAFDKNIDIISDHMIQLYKQMLQFDLYNPFNKNSEYNKANFCGIVVILQDTYLPRQHYYKKAQNKLHLEDSSQEWDWFLHHIKISSLYEIERISFSGKSLIEAYKACFQDDPYANAFMHYPNDNSPLINNGLLSFKRSLDDKMVLIIKDMLDKGYFQ